MVGKGRQKWMGSQEVDKKSKVDKPEVDEPEVDEPELDESRVELEP